MARWSIAVDTGGTFTDACGISPEGAVRRVKVLSSGHLRARVCEVTHTAGGGVTLTLDRDFGSVTDSLSGFYARATTASGLVTAWDAERKELSLDATKAEFAAGDAISLSTGEEGPLVAARLLTGTRAAQPLPPSDLRLATTRATNALLEDKGEPPLVVLPEGFSDLLEIGDQRRPELFALRHEKRRLALSRTIAAAGRLSADGSELHPFDAAGLRRQIEAIPPGERRTAAVALLHSYRDPGHERAAEELLRDAGFKHVSVSSSLSTSMRILPRAQTAVVDAYLAPVMESFVDGVREGAGDASELLMMTSAGGLEPASDFRAKDSLLSGPAGGLVGALAVARAAGLTGDLITFDMGGTSTDVARVGGGQLPYQFEQTVGAATVIAPALRIETVAAGGGSVCRLAHEGLVVGPESAGADPGPACYGLGGPLTVTDLNLLLGRIDAAAAGIPLDPKPAEVALESLRSQMRVAGMTPPGRDELLNGLLAIAIDRMAEAVRDISVREGYDPAAHTLVAFGGAGPGHACALADSLGIRRVLIPAEAGLLSARGVAEANIERIAEAGVLEPLSVAIDSVPNRIAALEQEAMDALRRAGTISRRIASMRLVGQQEALEFEVAEARSLPGQFAERFGELFGYPPPEGREVELVALRVMAATAPGTLCPLEFGEPELVTDETVETTPFFTLAVAPGWEARRSADGSVLLERDGVDTSSSASRDPVILAELARGRLTGIVDNMGAMLKRCAISTNVREREDYSCALLDANGRLAVNAPHIPVHLGALGLCVRELSGVLELAPGDIAVTNHPAHGGSHLPDITLVAAAFDQSGRRIGYLANRAHHAEIGGVSPGSMPPDARNLAEEGVVIAPQLLVEAGQPRFDAIAALLANGPHPTRNPADNLADLRAQAAALRGAVIAVEAMGGEIVRTALSRLLERSANIAEECISRLGFAERSAVERLDRGAEIHVALRRSGGRLTVDFTGTSPTLAENLNATPAIVRSAVLYVLRLLSDEDLPLNEGLLAPVEIVLPECLLNPAFPSDPADCPPVVGGNVETSQRVVDTLLKALRLQAASQGTMNNLLFGNARFGYYETIAGGAGAGHDYPGADALHTHMTNTAITDPEVLEWRYPVRLREFSVRRGSGGAGKSRGGDGVVREFEFLEPLTLSVLAEHRVEAPFGLSGGGKGEVGRQFLIGPDGAVNELPGRFTGELPAGSVVRMETPGGGACG